MPTTTLTPSGIGAFDNWTLGAGGSKAVAVDPPDDDDTTYIEESTNGERQDFVTDDLPPEADRVTTHTLFRRIRRTGGTGAASVGYLRLDGVNTDSGTAGHGTAYEDQTNVDLVKPGGGTYTNPADVNATNIGVQLDSGDSAIRCTTLKWDITWDAAPGGFAIFVGSLIGGAIGSAVGLHEIPKLAAYLAHVTGRKHVLRPYEHETLWRDLSLPRRRYSF